MLRSPSAGKLLQYRVEDGGHVAEGNVVAEIEVSFAEESWRASVPAVLVDGKNETQQRLRRSAVCGCCLLGNCFTHPRPGDEDHHDAGGGGGWASALHQAAGRAAGGGLCHSPA